MASAVLALENAPDDRAAVDTLLREAHTMKGAAGMVGLTRVSRLAHRLEDLLAELKAGTRRATPELTDALLRVVDGLGKLITSAGGEQDLVDETALEGLLPPHAGATVAAPPPTSPVVPEPQPAKVQPRAKVRLRKATSAEAVAPSPVVASSPVAAAAPAPPVPMPAAPATSFPIAAAAPSPTPGPPAGARPAADAPNRRRLDATTLEVPVARIDELNRLVGEASAAQLRVGQVLVNDLHFDANGVTEYRELTKVINQLQEVTERTRMVTVGTLEPILHRTVRDSARNAGKNVRWEIHGEDIEVDSGVLEQLVAPLLHLVRNAVGHGVESPAARLEAGKPEQAVVALTATQVGSKVVIAISDDGAGINVAAVRSAAAAGGTDVTNLSEEESLHLIFRSGLSTANVLTQDSGRGVGLDVVASAVAAVRGQVEVNNRPGLGTEFRIVVPITLTIVPCLIVSVAGQPFALPMHRILRMLAPQPVQLVSGRSLALIDGQAVPVTDLATLLGLPAHTGGAWVLLGSDTQKHAFQVEAVLLKRDVVVRGLSGRLRDLKAISGAGVEPNGSILLVLDVPEMLERAARHVERIGLAAGTSTATVRPPSVLVVDDALMVRELQRSILERAGFVVRTATDGAEALAMLAEQPVDIVVTDIEMPNLSGFDLTLAIRAHPRLSNIPVLIVTSRSSEEDHQRGLDVGADGYIVKASFDEAGLLSAVSRLLGRSGEKLAQHRAAPVVVANVTATNGSAVPR